MNREIGAYEAKSTLPELLGQVQAGKRFMITHRSKPVAELGPPAREPRPGAKAAIEAFQVYRRTHPLRRKVNIKA